MALDLHYLLTFHGEEGLLAPQRLFGAAVLALQASPILPPSLILSVEIATPDLAGSTLSQQADRVRVLADPLSAIDLASLLATLPGGRSVLSAAYVLRTVVLTP